MSSGRNPVGGGSSAPTQYFCHQCNRTVNISPSPNSDLVCSSCNGGFLEEIENPNPNPIPNPFFATTDSPFSSLSFPFMDFGSRSVALGGDRDRFMDANDFDPLIFLQNYLQTLRASGANIQFVIELPVFSTLLEHQVLRLATVVVVIGEIIAGEVETVAEEQEGTLDHKEERIAILDQRQDRKTLIEVLIF